MKSTILLPALGGLMQTQAELQYTDSLSSCQHTPSKSHLGRAVWCSCTNACHDGKLLGLKSQCDGWLDPCKDLSMQPTCPSDQVLKLTSKVNFIPTGEGSCSDGHFGCEWEQQDWVWACCQCPAGYTSVAGGKYRGFEDMTTSLCVKCSGAGEVVSRDGAGKLQCTQKAALTPPLPIPTKAPLTAHCALSASQKQFIKDREGLCLELEESGSCHHTLGYGHDCVAHDCSKIVTPMTKASASKLFDADLPQFIKNVKRLPNGSSLNSNEFVALVDFSFNTGNSYCYLEKFFERYMEKKQYASVCERLARAFTAADGKKPTRGKINRRKMEAALCSKPTKVMSGC